jgi:hypothetical protein
MTLLASPSSQQNHQKGAGYHFFFSKTIEEGDGSCYLLFLRYQQLAKRK